MKEPFIMVSKMAMESIYTLMGVTMKVNGSMENRKVLGLIMTLKIIQLKLGIGRMASFRKP